MTELKPPELARSPIYSDERLQRICQSLLTGATRTAAAQAAGIHKDTLYEWMKVSPVVSDAVTRAEAEAEQRATQAIWDAIQGEDVRESSNNARWWLERRRRADYGPVLNLSALTPQQLREVLGDDGSDASAWPTIQAQAALPAGESEAVTETHVDVQNVGLDAQTNAVTDNGR